MKVFKVLSITTITLLVVIMTGCASAIIVKNKDESHKLQKTPNISAQIVAPEDFEKGAPVTEHTILDFYNGTARINLARAYIGENDSLDEYVKDSKEKLEDDIFSFMEFTFVSIDGIEFTGEDKRAIAFEALQDKVVKRFWVVYVKYDKYVFEITCYAEKDDFDSFKDSFNNAIASFQILK